MELLATKQISTSVKVSCRGTAEIITYQRIERLDDNLVTERATGVRYTLTLQQGQ